MLAVELELELELRCFCDSSVCCYCQTVGKKRNLFLDLFNVYAKIIIVVFVVGVGDPK